MTSTIRIAAEQDIPPMHRIRMSVTENRLSDPASVTAEDYRRMLTEAGRGWVYELDGRIVGFAVADLTRSNIWALFVDPPYERRGIGRGLHDTMLEWLFASGTPLVWLSTEPGSRAESFYRAARWQFRGKQRNGEARYEMTRQNWLARLDDADSGAAAAHSTRRTMDATEIIERFALEPHPEGGWYREIYRSAARVETERGPRTALTTIYYLLEQHQISRWHVVSSDEIWHLYAGAPLELLAYDPASRKLTRHVLTPPEDGHEPVGIIKAGTWQAARSLGEYSLMGCNVGPGFELDDFRFVSSLPGHSSHFTGPLLSFAELL
jgi:uncharacterized protein